MSGCEARRAGSDHAKIMCNSLRARETAAVEQSRLFIGVCQSRAAAIGLFCSTFVSLPGLVAGKEFKNITLLLYVQSRPTPRQA